MPFPSKREPPVTATEQAKHTPGPWKVGDIRHAGAYQLVIAEGQGAGFVCEVQAPVEADTFDEDAREANARLIAAAPDLLAALKTARERIAYCRRAHKDAQSGEGFPVEMVLDAAIAKAEGRAP